MIKLTQASSMNANGQKESKVLYLAPDAIESIAANPNYGLSSRAANTVIRMKVTGAIHYVDEDADFVRKAIG